MLSRVVFLLNFIKLFLRSPRILPTCKMKYKFLLQLLSGSFILYLYISLQNILV